MNNVIMYTNAPMNNQMFSRNNIETKMFHTVGIPTDKSSEYSSQCIQSRSLYQETGEPIFMSYTQSGI